MKILFVSDYLLAPYGGAQNSAKAHLKTLRDIAGSENVVAMAIDYGEDPVPADVIALDAVHDKWHQLWNELTGNYPTISEENNKKILDTFSSGNFDVVFLDNSSFGKVAKKIKKKYPRIWIVTNYHGIKRNSTKQLVDRNRKNPHI